MMWPGPAPMTRARSTNARSFSDSVCERMMRAVDAQLVMPDHDDDDEQRRPDPEELRARVPTSSRRIGARISARTNVGRTRKKSAMRIRIESSRPPTKPRDDPDEHADHDGHDRRQQPDDHRDPGAVDGQVQHVAAELVGAEEMRAPEALRAARPWPSSRSRAGPRTPAGATASTVKNSRISTPAMPSRRPARSAPANPPSVAQAGASAPTAARVRHGRAPSRADPRVEEAVDEVGEQVGEHDRDAEQQEDALQDGVVAGRRARRRSSVPRPGQLNTTSTVIAPAMT